MLTYVRTKRGEYEKTLDRAFSPLEKGSPFLKLGCLACNGPFLEGEEVILTVLGPGSDEEAQERAREGRYFSAVALTLHSKCARGE